MDLFASDPDFLAAYRRGERDAFERVYRAHVDDVARLVMRGFTCRSGECHFVLGVADPHDLSELVQETFVRAFSETARRNYKTGRPFRAYLLQIAKNLMIDRGRARRRQPASSTQDTRDDAHDIDTTISRNLQLQPPDPALLGLRRQQLACCRQYVSSLGEPQRSFYALRYQEALSQEQVAKRMGATRRRVRSLEEGLRKGLRRYLVAHRLWP